MSVLTGPNGYMGFVPREIPTMAGEKTLEDKLRDRITALGGWEVKIHGSEFQTGCPRLARVLQRPVHCPGG